MKKLILTFLMALVAFAAVAGERPVRFEELPERAQDFIRTYLGELTFSYAKYDSDITDQTYDVVFTDGTEVEFNRRGEWLKVEGTRRFAVPEAIVPMGVVGYVEANHPSMIIVEVERERKSYKVTLSNDLELVFDQLGRFKGYDD